MAQLSGTGYGDTLKNLNEQSYLGKVIPAYDEAAANDPNLLKNLNHDYAPADYTNKFIDQLASTFVDRIYAKTGQLPSQDQVHQYLASNATQGNATKFIQGNLNPDQLNAMADQHIQSNPDLLGSTNGTPESRILGLNDQLDKIYNAGEKNYVNSYDTNVFNPAMTRTADSLAGQGIITNPNSRYSLDQVEANRGRDISSGLNTLESNRAAGSVDLGKTIEQLLQSQQGINNQSSQFNQTMALNQDQLDRQNALQNKQLSLADRLGQLQAGQQSNNGLSGALGGGLSGAAIGATAGSGFGPGPGTAIGAGVGGLAGLLGGYFGTKK